jgi:hypothetical protein
MGTDHDKIQSALKVILLADFRDLVARYFATDINQENLKKYFYEMILDSLSLMNQTMKDREKFGLNNDKGYSIDDLANLYLVFSSQQSKDSNNDK